MHWRSDVYELLGLGELHLVVANPWHAYRVRGDQLLNKLIVVGG
jgi:hypothetical protein